MNNKLQTILIYLLFIWGFGLLGGYLLLKDKYDEQLYINKTLYKVIENHESNYNELESQYNTDLYSCYTLLESCQVSSKSECYVNGGWNCE
jgi:hypothetical protein